MRRQLPFLLVFLLIPMSVLASPSSEIDVVHTVDMQKVLDESIAGKALRSDIQAEVRKREIGLKAKKEELDRQRAELEKQKSVLSAAALAEKQNSFDNRSRDLSGEFDAQREEVSRMTTREMKKIVDEIDGIVKEISAENKYQLVLERDPRMIVYVNPQYDISAQVIERLNQKKLAM